MALPYLVKHIYNNGTDEVIRWGKKIYASGYAELIEHDDLLNTAIFRIRDDAYATYYKVHITKFRDPKTISVRCGCPYNLGEICRHEAAALFQLQEMLDKNLLGEKQLKYDQRHTVVKMKLLELKLIKLLTAVQSYIEAENFIRGSKATILEKKMKGLLQMLITRAIYSGLFYRKMKRGTLIQAAAALQIPHIHFVCTRLLCCCS